MTDQPDIAAIARGLSAKQREALAKTSDLEWLTGKEIGAAGATLGSLCWWWPKGGDPIAPCHCLLSRDYQDRPLRYFYRRTSLGSEVYAHLTGSTVQGEE